MSSDSQRLFSASPSMREVVAFVARAAAGRAGVMIRGEDGSGRRVVARAIHEQRPEPGPFITVDCAAFEAGGLEPKLFGSPGNLGRPGGPGGSDASEGLGDGNGSDIRELERVERTCLMAQANGGTLYFQNLTEASSRVQARLARILRDGEVFVDDSGGSVLDVRPMAGLDPGVDESVRDGRLREDLFRRLSAFCVDVPPLRNRRDDIPALAAQFVQDICLRMQTPAKTLSNAAETLVTALPWRGNATELRAHLESVIRALDGRRNIGIEDVLAQLRLDGSDVVSSKGGTLRQAKARFEREYIAAVLQQHRGRMSEAAKALGIQRTNLYRKMRVLQVSRIKRDTTPIGS